LDARLYRGSLHLFPAGFRRDFSADMLRDFEDDRIAALESGRAVALWTFRVRMVRDFARSLGVQWLRTGLPAIGVIAMAASLVFMLAVALVWRRIVIQLPSGSPDEDVIALVMLTSVVFLFIVGTILLTMWSARVVKRGTRRRG
jgi:hypothetical protein